MAINILLICGGCKKQHQNYRTSKPKRMKEKNIKLDFLKKHCRFCNKREIHKEKIIDKKK